MASGETASQGGDTPNRSTARRRTEADTSRTKSMARMLGIIALSVIACLASMARCGARCTRNVDGTVS